MEKSKQEKTMPLTAEDKLEIQELAIRYALAMDSDDIHSWLETWTDDGTWVGGLGEYIGKSSLKELFHELGDRIKGKRHIMTNFIITGESNHANMKCYMTVVDRVNSPEIIATGIYSDTLKRVNGRFKFLHRQVKLDPSFKT